MFSTCLLLSTPDLESTIALQPMTVADDLLVMEAIALLSAMSTHTRINDEETLENNSALCTSCLAVVDGTQLVGLFGEREVTRLAASGRSLHGVLLAEVIEPPASTLQQSELINPVAALRLLNQHKIQHLPVLDDSGQLVGLLTYESICRLLQPVELQPIELERVELEQSVEQPLAAPSVQARSLEKQTGVQQNALINILLEWQNRHHAQKASRQVLYERDVTSEHLTWGVNTKQVFGYSPLEMPQTLTGWFASVHPEDVEQVQTATADHLERQGHICLQYRWRHQNGHYLWIEDQAQFFADGHGHLTRIVGYVANISDRQQPEIALRESEAQLRQIFDNSEDVFFLKSLDSGQMIYTSPAWEELYQTPLQQTYQNPQVWLDFVHPDDRDRVIEFSRKARRGEKFGSFGHRILRPDGSIRWVWSRTFPIRNEAGEIYRIAGVHIDITEQKRIELELKAVKERYQLAIRGIGEGIWDWDIASDRVIASQRYWEILGYPHEDKDIPNFDYETVREQIHPEDRNLMQAALRRHLEDHLPYEVEFRRRKQSGDYIWCRSRGEAICDEAGKPIRMVGTIADITERKAMETALQASTKTLRQVINMVPGAVYKYRRSPGEADVFVFISQGIVDLYEYTPEQILNDTQIAWDIILPEDIEQVGASIEQSAATLEPWELEFRIRTASGILKWISGRSIPSQEEDGSIIWFGILTDISDRKQIQLALQESERRYINLAELSPVGIFHTHLNGDCTYVNSRWCQLAGLSAAEAMGRGWARALHVEDHDRVFQNWYKAAQSQTPFLMEYRFQKPNGVVHWLIAQAIAETDVDGNLASYIGTVTDITDRKRFEQALQESEQRYRDLAEAMPQMVWMTDAAGAVNYFNQRWYDYTGLSQAESMGLGAVTAIHPNERDRLLQQWGQSVTAGELFELECRVCRQDGLYRWFIARGLPARNPAGEIIGWVGTITDIDDFKHAELARQQSEARFRVVFEQAAVGIAETDLAGRFLQVNRCYCDMVGHTEADLLDQDLQSITPDPDELGTNLLYWQQLLTDEIDSFSMEKRLLCRNGALRWCHITVSPIRNSLGTMEYCLSIIQDIQDRKQAELALQASETKLNDVLSSAGASIGHFRLYQNGIWKTEYHSKGSERVFGYAPDKFLMEVWVSKIFPEDWAAIYEPMLTAIKAETEITLEYRFHHPDGSTRWISDTITSRWSESDRCWVMTAIGTDVSDRKQAERDLQQLNQELEVRIVQRTAALTESEARYRALFEQAAVGISRCSLSGRFLQVNQRFCELIGYSETELLELSWKDITHPDDRDNIRAEHHYLRTGELSTTTEKRCVHKDGRVQWVSVTVSMLYSTEGVIISDLAVVKDISDRKQIEKELQNSEKRLKEIISKTVDGILILDPQGQVLFGNPAAERIFSCHAPYCQGESLGIPIALQKTFELDLSLHNGSVTVVEVRVEEITWQEQKAFLAAVRDISQRKQAEMALQASELSYRTLAENLPGAVYKLFPDQNHKVIFFNDRLTTLLNLDPDDIPNQGIVCPVGSLIVSEDRDRVLSTIQEAIANQQPFQVEYCVQSPKTQEKRYLLEQGETVIDDLGQSLHVVGVLFDITDTKQAEEELRQINEKLTIANAELARATRLKDEFLANMSHELRTPLNAILGLSEVLQERTYGDLTEQQHRTLTTIQTSGQHLLELINDILDLAKIESGKLELQMTLVSIHQLCRSTAPFVQQQAFKKQISFSLDLAPDLDYIEVDERLIRQVLINLLSNAVKFTPSGGSVMLKVEGNLAEQSLCFSIIDTGIGIALEVIDKLFQPFVQVDSSLSRRYSGTGLGLALVRRMVELHKGKVTVSSALGQGSQFTVILPWSHANPLLAIPLSNASAAHLSTASLLTETKNTVAKPIVLLIEDNIEHAETLRAYLELKGFNIIVACNGLQALQLTQSQSFDLILMAIQMPDRDGLEAIRQIRSHQQERIPILAVTALAMPGDKEKCLAAGADNYLSKPISPLHLVSVMKKYLQLSE